MVRACQIAIRARGLSLFCHGAAPLNWELVAAGVRPFLSAPSHVPLRADFFLFARFNSARALAAKPLGTYERGSDLMF